MRVLRDALDKVAPHFEKDGRLARFYPVYDALDTILYTPGRVTRTASHVRDALDMKRMMFSVVIALLPCAAFAMFNTGYQAALAVEAGAPMRDTWREALFAASGLSLSSGDVLACVVLGALYFLPALLVTFIAGGTVEVIFAILRRHEVSEGFLVTGFLIPLILPATVPLWQVAVGTMFGVIFGKEIFGGVGMNFLNPALVVRAFLFFAYPAEITGDDVWIAAQTSPDGVSGATPLALAATDPDALVELDWMQAFFGFIPGSMGETSAFLCLLGALFLVATGIASYRTMLGVLVGTAAFVTLFNAVGSETNPLFSMSLSWHLVLGGWAFGTVFMATDPVSSSFTNGGKWIYGFCIGAMTVLIRVVNPAFPEGMMLAILFMNIFAPLIDHFFVKANIKRRLARGGP
jgi:Na+-transporting NADH:ubiquinone oxidoreductase subunit B